MNTSLASIVDEQEPTTTIALLDKEIEEKLPEFLELIEARQKATSHKTAPFLLINYQRLGNRLRELQERMEGKIPSTRAKMGEGLLQSARKSVHSVESGSSRHPLVFLLAL